MGAAGRGLGMSNIYSTNERDPYADNDEAQRLLDIINGEDTDDLTPWEQDFLESIDGKLAHGWNITEKQLFKLRDIKDKLL
jgi:hypothetical protein